MKNARLTASAWFTSAFASRSIFTTSAKPLLAAIVRAVRPLCCYVCGIRREISYQISVVRFWQASICVLQTIMNNLQYQLDLHLPWHLEAMSRLTHGLRMLPAEELSDQSVALHIIIRHQILGYRIIWFHYVKRRRITHHMSVERFWQSSIWLLKTQAYLTYSIRISNISLRIQQQCHHFRMASDSSNQERCLTALLNHVKLFEIKYLAIGSFDMIL